MPRCLEAVHKLMIMTEEVGLHSKHWRLLCPESKQPRVARVGGHSWLERRELANFYRLPIDSQAKEPAENFCLLDFDLKKLFQKEF